MTNIQNYILKNKFLLFLFLAVFFTLPFERIPTLEFFGFTLKLSYIFGLVFLSAVIFSSRSKLFTEQKLSTSDYFLILFWLSGAISLFSTPDLKRGLIILFLWAFVFLTYLVFSRILTNQIIRKKAEDVIVLVAVLVCVFGTYQFLGDSFGLAIGWTGLREAYTKSILGFPRIQSVALEPLYFANFLMVPFFITVKRYIQSPKFINLYFFALLIILINITLTISRGAYLSLGFAFLILLFYLLANHKISGYIIKFFGIITTAVISIIISLGLIFLLNGHSAQQSFVDHAVVENIQADGSASDRIQTYSQAFNLFKKKPILGNGLGSFGILSTPSFLINVKGYQTVNNEYFELLSETGVIGLTLFILFLLFILYEAWVLYKKKNDKEKLALVVLTLGCLAIFIQYNFFSTLYIIYIWIFLALLKGEAGFEKN